MALELDARRRAMLSEIGLPMSHWPAQVAQASARNATDLIAVDARQTGAARGFAVPDAPVQELDWDALKGAVSACRACRLCESRKQTVFGSGDVHARWMVVGEAPGENEDLQGEPFVGRAGQLLEHMLRAVGLQRAGVAQQGVYIANVLKCRPPGNRNPQADEVAQCEPFLRRQVALLQPQVILALGRFAARSLLQASVPEVETLALGKLRGRVHRYLGVPVIVSYHPAYLLRTPSDKARAWEDLCLARNAIEGISS